MPRVLLQLFVVALLLECVAGFAPAADTPATSVLHLTDGGFIAGELCRSEDPKVLCWRSPHFARPLEFPLTGVNAVHFALGERPPPPKGEYCFELVDDDTLYGDLLELTGDKLAIDSARTGRLHLQRNLVRRIYRWPVADSVYVGPTGLSGWKDSAATPQWRDEGGHVMTDKPGATLFGDVGVPEKAVIEVALSWEKKPDFTLALGVDGREPAVRRGFQFEVWDDQLVIVGESARDADVVSVRKVGAGDGQIRVPMYLDQKEGRLIWLSPSGRPLATLNVGGKQPPASAAGAANQKAGKPQMPAIRSGVLLTNNKGDVRLEHLRITRWNGLSPLGVREDQSRLHRTDGSVIYGTLSAYDPKTKKFTMRDGTTETLVEHDKVADMFLSPAQVVGPPPKESATGGSPPTLRVVYRDGSRYSGTVTRIEDTHITLSRAGIQESLRLPLAELRALVALRQGKPPTAPPAVAGRPGRLEMDGVSLKGRLVAGVEQADASCLVWHPALGQNAGPFRRGISGRIVYREPPPPAPKPSTPRANAVVQPGFVQVIAGAFRNTTPEPPLAPAAGGRRSLHLRSGDTLPCEVTGISEKGVTFKTPLSDATFVPHEKIKSVELIPTRDAPQLDEVKRQRLLTLPRLQKDTPPTHLICSKNGDFLRGRIQEMDEKRLKVEVRLETREIPRDRVAQIIWLHADELTPRKPEAAVNAVAPANRVQAMNANGNRLTFVVEKSDGNAISGTSDVLGACRVDLAGVDQVLVGMNIEQSAAQLAYHRWKLHHALEPKFVKDDAVAGDGSLTGMESPLVGQPGFSFKLDLLDGPAYKLADHKGRIVVLEFWATWCGPCLESMPLLGEIVREFGDRGVELLAINMEEQPEQIKSMIERHKLKIPVALDRDGVVAARYAVTAIPQTVVIDRDGKVARLFVGGGKKAADAVRKALHDLSGKPSPPPSP